MDLLQMGPSIEGEEQVQFKIVREWREDVIYVGSNRQ